MEVPLDLRSALVLEAHLQLCLRLLLPGSHLPLSRAPSHHQVADSENLLLASKPLKDFLQSRASRTASVSNRDDVPETTQRVGHKVMAWQALHFNQNSNYCNTYSGKIQDGDSHWVPTLENYF